MRPEFRTFQYSSQAKILILHGDRIDKKQVYYSTNSLWQWHKVNPKTVITFNNCMRSTDNLNLAQKHIMTSLSESPCLIIPSY